jgi:ribonuclease Z
VQFQIYSTGLYATWIFHTTCHTLFDCGEGAASSLGKRVFGIDRVCLTHGHTDHIAGLPTLINARNRSVGDPFRPLTVYYPAEDRHILSMKEFIRATQGNRLRYPLTWEPVREGATLPLSEDHRTVLETFRTQHNPRLLSLGYRLVEKRKRLRDEFRGRSDIGAILRDTPAEEKYLYEEPYDARLWTYTGDMNRCELEDVRGSGILLTDATFIDPEDRAAEEARQTHMTLEEAVELAAAAEVDQLYAIHLSERYPRDRIDEALEIQRRRHPKLKITAVYPRRTYTAK